MMLEYEWGNPAAAAAAMLLFGDDQSGQVNAGQVDRHQVFDHYGHGLGMDFFQQPQPLSAAALFSTSTTTASSTTLCHQRYGLALPPLPTRIGLNLGVRTYFSSASPEEEMMAAGRVCRRRTRIARCQAEGCGADLTHAKHYHRRHKVCEFHSKASIVIAAGLSQRFCQQCSRFHVLSEFDQGKRSCRKRLADHNRRRRKSQDLSTSTAITAANTESNNTTITTAATTSDDNNTNSPNSDRALIIANNELNNSNGTTTTLSSVPPPPPPLTLPVPMMSLGLGCGAVPAGSVLSASSPTTSPRQSVLFLSHLGDFRGHEHRFSDWDEGEDDGSFRGIYQNK